MVQKIQSLPPTERQHVLREEMGITLDPKEPIDQYVRLKRLPETDPVQVWMTVAVTAVVLVSALYIVLSGHYGQDSLKWAYGAIGTVIGYWLKR